MKNQFRFMAGVLALTAALLTGCWQKSVEPFYTERDLRDDPALEGAWTEKSNDATPGVWTFKKTGESRWALRIEDDGESAEFQARLFRLGTTDFLDLFSTKRGLSEIPAHHLIRFARSGDKIELSIISADWVKNRLAERPNALAHTRIEDPEHPGNPDKAEIVLTAPTRDLQKFVLENMDADGFFEGDETLTRNAK